MPQTLHRQAAVAGQFYPSDALELRQAVQSYLDSVTLQSAAERVAAVVVPHAGYVYSGPTAAHAYARIHGARPRRVLLLGCSHYARYDGCSIAQSGTFETPLGAFEIDEEFANRLNAQTGSVEVEPHVPEHALEVQLPFLAVCVGEVPIVPVLFGGPVSEWHTAFGERLAQLTDDTDLVIATSDLSHYSSEQEANVLDRRSLDAVLTQDCDRLIQGCRDGTYSLCSAPAIVAAMAYSKARDATIWRELDYRTSGASSGDFSRVVGYAAISMEKA